MALVAGAEVTGLGRDPRAGVRCPVEVTGLRRDPRAGVALPVEGRVAVGRDSVGTEMADGVKVEEGQGRVGHWGAGLEGLAGEMEVG